MKAGWEVKVLGELAELRPPKKLAKCKLAENDEVSFVPMDCLQIGTPEIGEHDFRRLDEVYKGYTYFSDGDVLLAKITPCFENGKIGIANGLKNSVGFGSSEFFVIRPHKSVGPYYLYYFLSQQSFRNAGRNVMSGAVGHKRVPKEFIEKLPIPLPPLEEQHRIVAILDEAFEGLDRAQENAEANLVSAQSVFLSVLRNVFANESQKWKNDYPPDAIKKPTNGECETGKKSRNMTRTGGKNATLRPIDGNFSLSVLPSSQKPRKGWKWSRLSDLAHLASGHTPSRKHPEYWGGEIPWISIKDARDHNGRELHSTLENTNPKGIANSSARVLPANTVCLSRTASVGYVTVMGREMSTSQDFVNWTCGNALHPDFLKFLLLSQGDEITRFSSGSVHQTIYFPEVKAFHICHPPLNVQREISAALEKIQAEADILITAHESKLQDLSDLRQSLLQKAFAGELTN